MPSKFISGDGRKGFLMYSARFSARKVVKEDGKYKIKKVSPKIYPPTGGYGLTVQEMVFLDQDRMAQFKRNLVPPRPR